MGSVTMFPVFLQRIERLQHKSLSEPPVWDPEAYSVISIMRDELMTLVRMGAVDKDYPNFARGLLTYFEVVTSAANALRAHPREHEAQEFVEEVEAFITELVAELLPPFIKSDLVHHSINANLESIWEVMESFRPPHM